VAVDRDPPGQLGPLARFHLGQVRDRKPHLAKQLRVVVGAGRAARPVLRDGAEAEFRRHRVTDLPDHEHPERHPEGARDAGRDGDTAARYREDDGGKGGGNHPFWIAGVVVAGDFPQPGTEQHPRLRPVAKAGRRRGRAGPRR
jgi:hypothetical protein